ncbi:hypothetical protein MASR1M90_22380 [Desulfovibrionales bacterium]
MAQRYSTKFEGVRYREHPTRTFGIRKDRYYVIRYRASGRCIEEAVGWESQNDARDANGRRISIMNSASDKATQESQYLAT